MLISNLKKALVKQKIYNVAQVFKRFDTNGDGYFDENEIISALTILKVDFGKDDLLKLIRYTDSNNDGRIDFDEF